MQKIDKIVIVCHKGILWLTQICIASIRYWYPDRDIYIVKDLYGGNFDTSELERYWNVKELVIEDKKYGSSLSKLGLYVLKEKQKILALDADILFVGEVMDVLDSSESEFVVNADDYESPGSDWFSEMYYNYDKLKHVDPDFIFPKYAFNGGQIVLTSGLLSKSDFEPFVEWNGIPCMAKKYGDMFFFEQGLLNYLLPKYESIGRFSMSRLKFMLWSNHDETKEIDLRGIKNKKSIPYMIHWAGTVRPNISEMTRSDIVSFYQKFYYSRIPFGGVRRVAFNVWRELRYGRATRSLKRCFPQGVLKLLKKIGC